MKPVRILLKKTGLAIYISHLDMNRCLSRAVIRAKIPLWYTEGFNPKPYLNFLCPLALGQEGLAEPLDLRIEGEISNDEIKESLSKVMPQGIEVTEVYDPVMKSAEIACALYNITLEFENEKEAGVFCEQAKAAIESGELTAEKRSKKGMKTVNLCEMINSFEIEQQGEKAGIKTVLPTGSTLNLNPDLLLDALYEKTGLSPGSRLVSRVCLYNESGEIFR
ncbi:MAG: DUF2344 domain-containing protein [Clostridia bacterium]|nr:DUF2344 domain-containing protein [Clostridia bacterium]